MKDFVNPFMMSYKHRHHNKNIHITVVGKTPYGCYKQFLELIQGKPILRQDWKDGMVVDIPCTDLRSGKTFQWHADIHWYKNK